VFASAADTHNGGHGRPIVTGRVAAPVVRSSELLGDSPAGLSEWAVHPGLGDAESQVIDSGWRVRQTDLEFLMSPEAREILRRERIVVIDDRRLQQAWPWSG
jgi:hypothetical protein